MGENKKYLKPPPRLLTCWLYPGKNSSNSKDWTKWSWVVTVICCNHGFWKKKNSLYVWSTMYTYIHRNQCPKLLDTWNVGNITNTAEIKSKRHIWSFSSSPCFCLAYRYPQQPDTTRFAPHALHEARVNATNQKSHRDEAPGLPSWWVDTIPPGAESLPFKVEHPKNTQNETKFIYQSTI